MEVLKKVRRDNGQVIEFLLVPTLSVDDHEKLSIFLDRDGKYQLLYSSLEEVGSEYIGVKVPLTVYSQLALDHISREGRYIDNPEVYIPLVNYPESNI